MSVLTISLGETHQLQVKVPVKGETNWSESFKTEFAQKIVEHDHTGNGKGAKIGTAALEDNAVTTVKITDSSVTTAKLADDAVTGAKIADNSITSAHIAADVVIDADIAPDSVGTSELKVDAVETENILDANVTTAKIADANVTAAKIGSDVVLSTLNDVSSSAPTAGQVLKWSGSEWGPGTDASAAAGTVVIANQTDATAYSPSEGDIVVVNAAVTFTQNLAGVTLITDQNITLQNYTIERVNIHSSATVTLDSNSGPGTFPHIKDCIIKANNIYIDNTNRIQKCKLECHSFSFLSTYTMTGSSTQTGVEDSTIICTSLFTNGTASVRVKIDRSNITTKQLQGSYNSIDSLITCYDGTSTSGGADVQVNGTSYLNSVYAHPFTINNSGIDTKVVLYCKLAANQTISTNNATKIVFNSEVIDNTSSFASGTFTAKVKGFYKVNTNVYTNSLGTTNANQIEVRSPSNSDIYAYVNGGATADSSSNRQSSFGVILELEVGEVIEIFTDSLDSSYTINAISNLSIEKIN